MFKVLFTDRALRDWKKLDKNTQRRIALKLREYSENPLKFAVRLSNSKIGSYRFRIGDYRVVFDLDGNNIIVLRVGHRKEIYR